MMGSKKEQAKKVITAFRQSKYKLNPDGSYDDSIKEISKDLSKAITELSTGLYEKDIHFVMELIQNAEDNLYAKDTKPQLDFELLENDPTNTPDSDGCLCIFNNETGFEKKNIRSISAVGDSTKTKADGFIGEKGIGFKSVYIVTSSPHIFSNGYQIKFYENDPKFILNYIVPYWVDEVPDAVNQYGSTTSILLPLKQGKKQQIIDHLEDIQAESILFLNKLKGLSINVEKNNNEITFKRTTQKNQTCKLEVTSNSTKKSSRYWVYKEIVTVPDDLNEEKRKGITEREIVIAFPLDNMGKKGGVFSYLPTEADSGFPFLVNTDFLLAANRESIQTGKEWNLWLRDAFPDVIVNALLDMQKESRFKQKVYEFIPLLENTTDSYFSVISESVCEKLQQLDFIYADRHQDLLLARDTRLAPPKVRDLFLNKARPAWFSSYSLVDSKINKYPKQLKAIGVTSFASSDLMECLDDSAWLRKCSDKWFLQLYSYLNNEKKGSKSELSYKEIIPIENNKVASPSDGIYWLSDQDVLDSLNKILINDDFPSINLIRPSLLAKLKSNPLLLSWIENKLSLTKLSVSSYIAANLLPWMDRNTLLLDSKKVILVTSFILEQWEGLSDDCKIGDLLPVILEDGAVYKKSDLSGHELLVPRGFDRETGWQIILKEPEEYDHSDVLSTIYLKLPYKNKESLGELIACIGAEHFPDFKEVVFSSWSNDNDRVRSFLHSIFLSEHATSGKQFTTWIAPLFLNDHNKIKVLKNRNALIYWLEAMHENRSDILKQGRFKWYYYSSQSKIYNSLLIHYLLNTPWINTSKGLKKPGEVFIDSDSIKAIFKNKLPYLKDDISSNLCDFLSIKSEVTTDTILDYLNKLSQNKLCDKSLVGKIYGYLQNYGTDFKEHFNDNKYIYVHDSKEGWYSINEVIWENAEGAFGDSFAWLSNHYLKLKDFFIDELEVKESVDDQSILDTWLKLQTEDSVSEEQVGAYLSFAIPKIVSMAKDDEHDDILEPFFEEAMLWVQTQEWLIVGGIEEVYIPDDIKLRNLFKDQEIYFPWRIQSTTHAQQSLLYEKFELPKLSESVSYQVVDFDNYTVKPIKTILTDYSVQLICEMIVNEDKSVEGWFEQHIATGLVSALFHAEEKESTSLEVEVSLNNLNNTLPEVSAFFDKTLATLFINKEDDIDDIKDDVAESLAREIWPYGFKSHVDTITKLLAVTSHKRYKKINESKGWTFSEEYREKLKEVSTTPFRLDESESSTEETHSKPDGNVPTDSTNVDTVESGSDSSNPPTSSSNEHQGDEGGMGGTNHQDATSSNNSTAQSNTTSRNGNSNNRAGSRSRHHQHNTSGSPPLNRREGRQQTGSQRNAGSRVSNAKSGNINRNTNNIRRNRMVSYVVSELTESSDSTDNAKKQQDRKKLGDLAEQIVCDDLSAKGYSVKRMPENNKGYDIEAINPENGELYYIEVKGDAYQWSDRGVGISTSQYQYAIEKQLSFYLAVVDNLLSIPSKPVYIRDPASCITEYRFDHKWSQLATDLKTVETSLTVDDVVKELVALTDSDLCKYLINYCDENKYPFPDIGVELTNDMGEVIYEGIELAWEREKVAVVLDEDDIDGISGIADGWKVFLASKDVALHLDDIFQVEELPELAEA